MFSGSALQFTATIPGYPADGPVTWSLSNPALRADDLVMSDVQSTPTSSTGIPIRVSNP